LHVFVTCVDYVMLMHRFDSDVISSLLSIPAILAAMM